MINEKQHKKLSKFLSLILRHKPEEVGLELNNNGWADTSELINKLNQKGKQIDFETLDLLVQNSDKQRFAFNEDKTKIRANQGHSISIDLGYKQKTPPEFLYHGTASRFMDSIYKQGIQKQNRHHVHLSKDINTAVSVGKRHGKPVVLKVLAAQMLQEDFVFYESKNGVWLTDEVPTKFFIKLVL